MTHFKHYTKLASTGLLLATLSGCASLNVGESEFECSGMPGDFQGGAACASATEVYEMTNNGEVPNPVTHVDRMKEEQQNRLNGGSQPEHQISGSPAGVDPITQDYVTPALPNRPVPIRTPAKVMRIWVAPWEDTARNLNVPGYVYTEIEPRRWTVGERAPTANPSLRPLQMGAPASEEAQSKPNQRDQSSGIARDQRPWLQ